MGVGGFAEAKVMKVLYKFPETTNAYGSFVVDGNGLTYGTGTVGGASGYGTVFRFDPRTKNLVTLYSFLGGADGANPVPGMVLSAGGTLYGATTAGGAWGGGTVFAVDIKSGTEKVLHSFGSGKDGMSPQYGPIFGADGKLYGTTPVGGASGYGAFYRVNQNTGAEEVVFNPATANNGGPNALTLGSSGLLYGTSFGNADVQNAFGTIFAFDPTTKAETVLYSFAGNQAPAAIHPVWGVVLGKGGVIFGTGRGVPFEFDPSTGTVTELPGLSGGITNTGRLLIDASGNIYGTQELYSYGSDPESGFVYVYNPASQTPTTLYQFKGRILGQVPCGIVFGKDGNLYGATLTSGNEKHPGYGTIFSVTP